MQNFFEKKLQSALNRFLMMDPESKSKIASLNGKVISIRFSGTPIRLQLIFAQNEVRLNSDEILTADTIITGTPLTLAHLSLSKNKKSFFEDDVMLAGDVECGQQVLDLFDTLEIDWEEYLSQWIGDMGAHKIGQLARRFISFRNDAKKSILDNINEYLHEEIKMAPPLPALEHFFEEVDTLRLDTDRLEQKITKLESELEKGMP